MMPDRAGEGTPGVTDDDASHGGGRRERKYAAVLFADIVGSTALAEREDPEVVQSLIGSTFDRMSEVVTRFGGTVEKFIGDALLAVFGVPATHEDDPERAVRAALAIQELLAERRREAIGTRSPPISMRIGIEAGELLVDRERVDGPRDRMLTGDVVNTAARLQHAAEPGAIVVGPQTHAATGWAIEYRDLGTLELKGKAAPVRAWRAIRARERVADRPPIGLEARLTGRDEEMTTLLRTALRVASERRPWLVTILGAAGVGKTRLATELRDALEDGTSAFGSLSGRCLPYGSVSYSALAEAVKQGSGILDDDPIEVVTEKTARTVEGLFGDDRLVPMLGALVGSSPDHRFSREELFSAWRRFLERLAEGTPLMLVLEDIHWADDGLLDFVNHMSDRGQGPILLVTLARPELLEHRPSWGADTKNHTSIDLDPLSPDEMRDMVDDLLSSPLPEALAESIARRSEGNPLFGEEIVRMLIERGAIRRDGDTWNVARSIGDVEVPPSVQRLIASRLDSLPEDEKASLQDAAVIGRAFWIGAVQRLSELDPHDVRETLRRVRAKEILSTHEPSAFAGEVELSFRHALFRDAAYASLPKALRAQKHVAAAAWIEERAGEQSVQLAELLATHYVSALEYLDQLGAHDPGELITLATRWARAAGDRASTLWQEREAARWFHVVVDLVERVASTDDELAGAWEGYARAAEAVEPYRTIAAASERALELYERAGRVQDAGRVEAWLAHVAFQSGDDRGVERWAERALDHLEPLGASRDLALALVHLGWYEHRHGRDAEAAPSLQRAMAMARAAGDPSIEGRAMLSLGMVTLKSGSVGEGMRLLDAGLDLARGAGELPFLLWALLVVSEGLELSTCDYRRAESLVREGLDLASRAGHVEQIAWMQGNLADYLVDMGRLDEAMEPMVEGLRAARAAGETPRIAYSLLMNAYVHTLRGELDEADGLLDELRVIVERSAETYHEGWVEVVQTLIARARGNERVAVDALLERARIARDRLEPWGGNLLLLECIRSIAPTDRSHEASDFRERLAELSVYSASSRAFLAWADGLMSAEPNDARRALDDAVRRFGTLERQVELARCLIDLAAVVKARGGDPGPDLARARDILRTCGATLFLREVDAAEPATEGRGGGGPA
jgi:class 3 adenylate cyclase/tetratricopeptide (TPR) repeat protein